MPLFISIETSEGNKVTLPFEQVIALALILEANPGVIWHPNHCGCCVSAHHPDDKTKGWIVGSNGEVDVVEVGES